MNLPSNEVLGALSIAIACIGYISYFRSIAQGITKPHPYSRLVWAILCFTTAAIQYNEGAGPGMWATLVTGIACSILAVIGFTISHKYVTKKDFMSLVLAFVSIVFWLFIDSPLMAMLLIVAIDVFAFYPMFRKAWNHPHTEHLGLAYASTLKLCLSFMALNIVNIITALPIVTFIFLNIAFILLSYYRRNKLGSCAQ